MSTTQTWDQGRIVERVEDNGDGTGTRTTYDTEGQVTGTEDLTGLPIPEPAQPTDAERIASLEATVAALLAALEGN